MKTKTISFLWLIFICITSFAQKNNDYKMQFPNIYFKPYSEQFAKMPYSIDSCANYLSKTQSLVSITINLHSDSSEQFDTILAKKRIETISNLLLGKIICKTNIRNAGAASPKVSQSILSKISRRKHRQNLQTLNNYVEFGIVSREK